MSLSRDEFDKSLEAFAASTGLSGTGLAGAVSSRDAETIAFTVAGGQALVTYRALEPKTFGGLLKLPRAEVTLAFKGVGAAEQAAFVRTFDIAFQRGGG